MVGASMSIKTQFTTKLLFQRKMRHLTQEQTAEKLGISTRWYQKIETGHSEPNLELTCKIAREFDINFSLFYDEIIEDDYNML